jgi:DNA-binding FadR family transcriptional regulator
MSVNEESGHRRARLDEGGAPGRVAAVERALREAIGAGRWGLGDKLPTEAELTRSLGVSRSVLREAVAILRADGLLEARQGAGVFVRRREARPGPLALLTDRAEAVADVIEELELRAAVEIEAAGLAAVRASPAQLAAIEERCEAFGAAIAAGAPTEDADFAFHVALAKAANNARFAAFLAHLGARTIPRVKMRAVVGAEAVPSRDAALDAEHRAIAAAVVGGDADAAREAMRAHLGGAMRRYRSLIHRRPVSRRA